MRPADRLLPEVGDVLVAVVDSDYADWCGAAMFMHLRPLRCDHGGQTKAEL